MPIYHEELSGRVRWTRAGKWKLGEKRRTDPDGPEYPAKLDYFRAAPGNPDDLPNLYARYGEQPKSLPIMFPVDDEPPWDNVFPQYLKCYGLSGLKCKGDGIHVYWRVDKEGGVHEFEDGLRCDPNTCEHYQNEDCGRVASLMFMLRGYPSLSLWQLDTGSVISITNVNSKLAMLKSMRQFGNRIDGIPLMLKVYPVEVKPDDRKFTVYVIDIDLDPTADYGDALRIEGATMGAVELPTTRPGDAKFEELPAPAEKETPDQLYPKRIVVEGAEESEPEKNPLRYEDVPPDIKEAAGHLKWTPGLLLTKLGAFATGGVLNVAEAAQMIATELARGEAFPADEKEEVTPAAKEADKAGTGVLDF